MSKQDCYQFASGARFGNPKRFPKVFYLHTLYPKTLRGIFLCKLHVQHLKIHKMFGFTAQRNISSFLPAHRWFIVTYCFMIKFHYQQGQQLSKILTMCCIKKK